MKVAALVVLSVLIALPAEAAQRRQQNVSPSCDNDGRCTTSMWSRRHRARHQASARAAVRTKPSMPMAMA